MTTGSTQEALKIASDFGRFLKTGDDVHIKHYTKADLKRAVSFLSSSDRHKSWYQEIVKRTDCLEKTEEEKRKDKWYQRPLFVGITSAVVTGIFAVVGGYMVGVEKTVNNVPIQSNNRQYGNIYAQQIIFNENGTFKINGTALDQATGSTVKFTAVSQDATVVSFLQTPSEVTAAFDKIGNSTDSK